MTANPSWAREVTANPSWAREGTANPSWARGGATLRRVRTGSPHGSPYKTNGVGGKGRKDRVETYLVADERCCAPFGIDGVERVGHRVAQTSFVGEVLDDSELPWRPCFRYDAERCCAEEASKAPLYFRLRVRPFQTAKSNLCCCPFFYNFRRVPSRFGVARCVGSGYGWEDAQREPLAEESREIREFVQDVEVGEQELPGVRDVGCDDGADAVGEVGQLTRCRLRTRDPCRSERTCVDLQNPLSR